LFKRLEVEGTTSGGVAVSPTEPNPGFIAPKVNAGGGIAPNDPKHEKRNARAKVKQQKTVRKKYALLPQNRGRGIVIISTRIAQYNFGLWGWKIQLCVSRFLT